MLPHPPLESSRLPWAGILAGIGAAVFYTLANVFLRKLAMDTDPAVVVFVKAFTTACVFVPWLMLIASSGKRVLPLGKYAWIIVFGSIQTQIFGNYGQQVSFGIIGMAIGVPIYIGSLVASSAILGRLLLKETVSTSVALSLVVLVSAVCLLSLGGKAAGESVNQEQSQAFLANAPFLLGVAAAIGVGLAYAVLGVCIRCVLQSGVPPQTPPAIVSFTGAMGYGMFILSTEGLSVFEHYSASTWAVMTIMGLCNAIAFLCLSKSLQLLPVVYVNAINVSQVAMAAAVGVLLFAEPLSVWLSTGLALMVVGFGLLSHFGSKQARVGFSNKRQNPTD